jgi:GTPase SAR1 family protein
LPERERAPVLIRDIEMTYEVSENLFQTFTELVMEEAFPFPGLTDGYPELNGLIRRFKKGLQSYLFKEKTNDLWVVFLGGTGTGKSTLFNALCGKTLSATGVERPKTRGPVAYAHRSKSSPEEELIFPGLQVVHQSLEEAEAAPCGGMPGKLMVLSHEREEWSHLVIVDTPDVDSVEAENREITEDLTLLADALVFVTSQEKYADEVPIRFLLKVLREQRPSFLLVNKAEKDLGIEEVAGAVLDQGIPLPKENIWLIPLLAPDPEQIISEDPHFLDFRNLLLNTLSTDHLKEIQKSQSTLRAKDLDVTLNRFIDILKQEVDASRRWEESLEELFQKASQDLIHEEKERFIKKSKEYLKKEIRGLFRHYDVLARPRLIAKSLLTLPFRLLGFRGAANQKIRETELQKVREKMDLEPVLRAVEQFRIGVLESLPSEDEKAPLFRRIRDPEVTLSREAIVENLLEEQKKLEHWLEKTFEELAGNMPKSKKWGIYSTSILWGILILSLEVAIGGGFTILDAALDSALAPFVTKGAVELFAYQEIRRVAHELSQRYQDGLLSVLRRQKSLYEECIGSLLPSPENLKKLETLRTSF